MHSPCPACILSLMLLCWSPARPQGKRTGCDWQKGTRFEGRMPPALSRPHGDKVTQTDNTINTPHVQLERRTPRGETACIFTPGRAPHRHCPCWSEQWLVTPPWHTPASARPQLPAPTPPHGPMPPPPHRLAPLPLHRRALPSLLSTAGPYRSSKENMRLRVLGRTVNLQTAPGLCQARFIQRGRQELLFVRIQPLSQKSRTATVPKMFQIGLCGVMEADLELFRHSWSAGFFGERL